jgi:hypothetical protein
MDQKRIEPIVAVHADFRDHIGDALHAEHELQLQPAFALVVVKSVGYCFNTYKAIGHLLPEYYYEYANVLMRILWEAAVNLAWVAAEPDRRAQLFTQFTIVERRKFIQMRVNESRRIGLPSDVSNFEEELKQFDHAFATVLAD